MKVGEGKGRRIRRGKMRSRRSGDEMRFQIWALWCLDLENAVYCVLYFVWRNMLTSKTEPGVPPEQSVSNVASPSVWQY